MKFLVAAELGFLFCSSGLFLVRVILSKALPEK